MTSVPIDGNVALRKAESDSCMLGLDWINVHKPNRHKSEDGLSLISSEYDECPEFDNIDNPGFNFEFVNEVELSNAPISTSDLESTMSAKSSNKTLYKRHGSSSTAAMRELGTHLFYRFNWKFNTSKVSDFLRFRTAIVYKKPIYFLGKKYFFEHNHSSTHSNGSTALSSYQSQWLNDATKSKFDGGKKEFQLDFRSKFWLTYRQNFCILPNPVIKKNPTPSSSNNSSNNSSPNSNNHIVHVEHALRTSDCGWGCMLRSGQMILAQGLCMHFLGRSWNVNSTSLRDKAFELQIIKWFADNPRITSPFSIHQIMKISNHMPGDWFGPYSISVNLRKAFAEAKSVEPKLQSLEFYFAPDRIIYKDEVMEKVQEDFSSDDNYINGTRRPRSSVSSRGVIILIPVQLGHEKYMAPSYNGILHRWLRDPQCLGIIGGKPNHSIYMLGYQDNNVIYLDPHFPQATIDVSVATFPTDTYHCMTPMSVPFSELDPSCAVGFYCRGEVQLASLLDRLQTMSTICTRSSRKDGSWNFQPVIEVISGYPSNLTTITTSITTPFKSRNSEDFSQSFGEF